MSINDEMTIDERRKYLRKMQKRYKKAGRAEKGKLLDEMEKITGLHRKYLIELIQGDLQRKPRRRQRGRTYGPEVDDALRVIYESFDYICAERLTPNLVWMAEHLARHGELETSATLMAKLEEISISTVGRILQRIRQDEPRLPRRKRPKQSRLFRDIPMKRIPWDIAIPGHFEVDLVHHCGPTASGEYMCTLQMIDVATGWSERIAVLGRSYLVMEHAFRLILRRLPFPVLEIHPDNGSEFINHHLRRFWGCLVQDIEFSRSHPFQKNDNRNVEQKNFTLVRAYLGYDRLDSVAQTLATNQLFDKMWIYYNLFQPVMHLAEKQPLVENGHLVRVKRRHDQARTPFDRLCQAGVLLPEHQEQLEILRQQTNPRLLRQQIYQAIDDIFSLPGATPGLTEHVFDTFPSPESNRDLDSSICLAFNRTAIREMLPCQIQADGDVDNSPQAPSCPHPHSFCEYRNQRKEWAAR
jgi:hypothetical protein